MQGQSVKTEPTKAGGEEQSKRRERAHRILNAAAELLLRWGYKKTTMDDIARLAGVAKGTLYLHWRRREDLFAALTIRESLETTRDLLERIDRDPAGIYLSHMLKHCFAVVMARPLARAIFTRDTTLLGDLLQSDRGDLQFISQEKLRGSEQLFLLFREKGLLRTDRSVDEQVKMCMSILIGFMFIDQYLTADFSYTPEKDADMLADTVRGALEPLEPVSPEILVEMKGAWDMFTQSLLRLLEERVQQDLG